MSLRTRAAGIGLAATVVAGAGLVQIAGAAPAFALPPGACDWTASADNAGMAVCTSTGIVGFRVTIKCAHNGVDYTNYGPWVRTDQTSVAQCDGADLLATAPSNDTASVFYQFEQ
jgi:hypothetical protein